MRRKYLWIALLGLLLAAGAGLLLRNQFYGNCVREQKHLYIASESDYRALTAEVLPAIRHRAAFRLYARRIGLERSFKPGHYVLREGMSAIRVARMLKLGEQTPVMVSLNNVRTPAQLAGRLSRQLMADSASMLAALRDPGLAREVGFDTLTLMALFIPDSYEFYWTTQPADVVRRMRREYDRFWTAERKAKLKRTGLSQLEATTLASIVYEETKRSDEMPTVAGVYINRLRRGIPLQADPTVKYALGDFTLRRVLKRHLQTDSPYNTYRNRGLPPSPICMPSVEAIDAVLDYREHDYLYFCARPTFDGYHNFASTLAEHNANARAYARELNRRKIYR